MSCRTGISKPLILACAIALTPTLTLQGCTSATVAGCGVGVLSTMALVGLAALADNTNKLDADTVIFGSVVIGMGVGCPAGATAESLARADERTKAAEKDRERRELLREAEQRLRVQQQTQAQPPPPPRPPPPTAAPPSAPGSTDAGAVPNADTPTPQPGEAHAP
jgi:hypothetical protein